MQKPKAAESAPSSGSTWNLVKTIAWAFFGVRKRKDHENAVRVSPLHVVIAGFVGVFVLVGALIVLVNWVAP
jgi:hypothetical protein